MCQYFVINVLSRMILSHELSDALASENLELSAKPKWSWKSLCNMKCLYWIKVSQHGHGKVCATWNVSLPNQCVPKWSWKSLCYMKYVFPEWKSQKMIIEKVCATWNTSFLNQCPKVAMEKFFAAWNMSFRKQSVPKWQWKKLCYMKYVFPEPKCPKIAKKKFVLREICLSWIKVSQNGHGKVGATYNMSSLNQSVPKWQWKRFCYLKYVFPEPKCP